MPEHSFANKQLPLLCSSITPPPAVYLWDELPQIQDGAARGALVGTPLENLRAPYQARLDRTVAEIDKRSSLYTAAIDSEVERLTRDLAEYEALRKSLEEQRELKREALPGLRKTEKELEAEVRGILLTMLGNRVTVTLEQ